MNAITPRRPLGLAMLILCLCLSSLAAQTTLSDPNDPLYADMDAWTTKGLIKNLPRLRPYTASMAIGILKEVAASDNEADAAQARIYLDGLRQLKLNGRGDALAQAMVSDSGTQTLLMAAPGLSLEGLLSDNLGASLRMSVWLTQGEPEGVTPYGERFYRDPLFGTGSKVGSLEITQDVTSSLSYGNEGMGVQAGYMRGSWGPVWEDGVVVGPQAPESGQLTFSWRSPTLSTDVGFYMLQQGWPSSTGILDTGTTPSAVGFNSNKYLMVHGINWAPHRWLELGFFESMVWVDRIEPLYFIPLSEYFVSQSVAGFADNSFAGLSASVYLPSSMKLDLVAYADDFDFAGILKGNLDTKWKVALQAALSWAPELPILQRISMDYTIIGPYTYTHWEDTGQDASGKSYFGALAYTNAGQNVGPALDPNSDRISIHAHSRELHGARISGLLQFIRHGNASAGVSGYSTSTSASGDASGDLGDPGLIKTGDVTNPYTWIFAGSYPTGTWPVHLRFLTQSVIQMSALAGLSVDYSKAVEDVGIFTASLGYSFEYTANADLVAGATSVKHYLSLKVGLSL